MYRRTDVLNYVVYVYLLFMLAHSLMFASVRTMHVHHVWDVITNALLYVHTYLVLKVDIYMRIRTYVQCVCTYVRTCMLQYMEASLYTCNAPFPPVSFLLDHPCRAMATS